MKVDVIRGRDEIGGSIIEVDSGGTRILLDAGAELSSTTPKHRHSLDFDTLLKKRGYDAIFVTHYHSDHLGLLEEAGCKLPPIYMGELAYRLYDVSCAYRDSEAPFGLSGHLVDGDPITIGDLTVTPVFCDHSAADSYSLVVTDGKETLLYTGDFRSNGRKDFQNYLSKLPEHVDNLVIEGTTTSREASRNMTERELEERMAKIMRECSNQVFVLFSALNIDRVTTVYKAARKNHRTMLMDPYMAAITMECREHGIHIPNPTFDGVGVFLSRGVDDEERSHLCELYGSQFLGKFQYAQKPFSMCVRSSMLPIMQAIDKVVSLNGSTLVYSIWDGYKRNPLMAQFLEGVKKLGIEVVSAHASGHADVNALESVIDRTNPVRIIPVHTENALWFNDHYPDIHVLHEE